MIQKIGIIGGGVSGLSSYYYLRNGISIASKANKDIKINIFEKSNKIGGNIQTNIHNDAPSPSSSNKIIVEEGPRSLRSAGRGLNTLELVKRLGISNEIIFSNKKGNSKFLLLDGKVQEIPMNSIPKILYFSIKYGLFNAILKEPFQRIPKQVKDREPNWDESIFDFFSRRFGKKVAQTFAEPMCLGIHAGDYTKLSIKSCFPGMTRIEQFNGLILGSLFPTKKHQQIKLEVEKAEKNLMPTKQSLKEIFDKDTDKTGVFSFKDNGLSKIIQQIRKSIDNDYASKLYLSTSISEIQKNRDGTFKVIDSNGVTHQYDQLISTVPFNQLASMFEKSDPTLYQLLKSMDYTSIAVVNLVYKSSENVVNSIKDKGFGYLIPSKENIPVIGVCFDSNTFPEFVNNNNEEQQSIITIMIGGNNGIKERNDKWTDVKNKSKEDLLNIANKHLEEYLGINSKPDISNVTVYENGIPHYSIGHQNLINQIQQHISANYGSSFLLGGNSLDGVSINDAIFKSKQLVQSLRL